MGLTSPSPFPSIGGGSYGTVAYTPFTQTNAPSQASKAVEKCNIYMIDRKDTVKFQFAPFGLRDTKSADYSDISILGRSSPFKSYSGNRARNISFSIDFFAAPEQGRTTKPSEIKTTIYKLLSLPYPDYSSYVIKPPTKCLLSIGDIIKDFRCVCRQATASYKDEAPWSITESELLPYTVTLSFSFDECVNSPLDYRDILKFKFNK